MLGRALRLTAAVAIAILTPATGVTADPLIIRLGTIAPAGTPWETQLDAWKRSLAELSGGKVHVKAYLGGLKGTENEMVAACKAGDLDIVAVTTAALATEIPAFQVLELPFLFNSAEELDYVLDNHVVDLARKLADQHGYVFHSWGENGFQNYGSRDKAILKPADLHGLKVRSQESTVHIMAWQTFGAVVTPIDTSKVREALRQGSIVAFEQTPIITFVSGWYREIKHYTVSHHIYQPAVILYSKKFFAAQSPQIQAVLLSRDADFTTKVRRELRLLEPELLANLAKAGVEVHTLSVADREAFAEVARRSHSKFVNHAAPEALEMLRTVIHGKAEFAKRAKP